MTRKKKTRSLKNIHNIKTGNPAKLKREAGTDRQKTKRLKGRRIPSVFEKFLEENQEAKKALTKDELNATQKAEQKRTPTRERIEPATQTTTEPTPQQPRKTQSAKKAEQDAQPEPSNDLLDQLDSSSFKDIY